MENKKYELPPLSLPSSPDHDHTIPLDVKSPPSTWQTTIGDGSPNQLSRPLPTQRPPALRSYKLDKIGQEHSTWQSIIGDGNPYQSSRRRPTEQLGSDRFEDYIAAARNKLKNEERDASADYTTTIERPTGAYGGRYGPYGDGEGNPYQSSRRRPTQQLGSDPFEDYIAAARNKLKNEERERSNRPSTTSASASSHGGGGKSSQLPAVGGGGGEGEGSYQPSIYGADYATAIERRPADVYAGVYGRYGEGEGSSQRQRRPTDAYGGVYGEGERSSQRQRRPTGVSRGGEGSSQRTAIGNDTYARYIAATRRDEKRKDYQPNTWRSKPAYGDEEGSDTSSDEEGRTSSWLPKPAYGDGEGSVDTFATRNKTENEPVIRSYDRPAYRFDDKLEKTAEDYIKSVKLKYRNEELTGTRVDPEIIKRYSNVDLSRPAAAAKVERIVDPDGESSSLCSGCKLPIFSTPSISVSHGGDQILMHEQCATLPPQWLHELHPQHALLLHNQLHQEHSTPVNCHNCRELCGTLFYQCPNSKCDFRLDLLCVVQIKIIHRSHRHTLTAIRQRESDCLTCSACDTKHDVLVPLSESQRITLSYLCHLCGFWIHPDCALLPNAILHYEDHKHSLFLTYNLPNPTFSKCFLCSQLPKSSSGVYFCLKCPDYLVHIRCTRKYPSTFKPVFIRDAKVSDLARLPLPNESTSLIPYLRQDISEGDVKRLHPHPLILNKIDESPGRVCNACVQTVAPPFYSCSTCPDFYLHSCCAKLPTTVQHPIHEHPLSFSPKAPKSDISAGFTCRGCHLRCNGFAYSCTTCDDFSLDVSCAMINPAITHESHKSTHILFMTRDIKPVSDEICNCCRLNLKGICYECSICRSFKLHARCALLPKTIRHGFDEHPLQLTTANDNDDDDEDEYLCEVCEEHIERVKWYYTCSECNQLFHVDCIPSVDRLSKIKLGCTVRIVCHGCPLALVRENEAVWSGRRCRICWELLESCGDGLAYECSKCFYVTHQNCI